MSLEDDSLIKTAEMYQAMGSDFFKISMSLADASSEYGVGAKLRGSFTNLVRKLIGRLKESGRLKGTKKYRARRRKK